MHREALAPLIDHTVLGPTTTPADVRHCLEVAAEYGMNACIPPYAVDLASDVAPEVTLATVIGFPHGQHDPTIKRQEGVCAWQAGADELDVVLNVARLKAGDLETVEHELTDLVAAVPIPVKVIIETPLLTAAEKDRACELAVAADAAMVKTATGFATPPFATEAATGGATVADVERMAAYLPVKASGGIGSYEAALAMLEAGADRIGASSGATILEGAPGD